MVDKVVEFTAIFAVGSDLDKAQLVRVTHTRQADGSLLREENRLTPAQARECRMALERGDLVPDIRAKAAPGRQMLLPKELVDPSHQPGYKPYTPPEAVSAPARTRLTTRSDERDGEMNGSFVHA